MQPEKHNLVRIKYKRKVSHIPIEEKIYKFKMDPSIFESDYSRRDKEEEVLRRVEDARRGESAEVGTRKERTRIIKKEGGTGK